MGKGLIFANLELRLIANGLAIPNVADNAASSPLTSLYWALHVLDPTAGDQTTGEVGYGGYARVPVARTTAGLVVTGSNLSPAYDVAFPVPTASAGASAYYASLGTAPSGAGIVLWSGLLTPSILIVVGTPPIIASASSIVDG